MLSLSSWASLSSMTADVAAPAAMRSVDAWRSSKIVLARGRIVSAKTVDIRTGPTLAKDSAKPYNGP